MILTKIRKVLEEIKKSALFTGTLAANAEQAMDSQGQLNIFEKLGRIGLYLESGLVLLIDLLYNSLACLTSRLTFNRKTY